LRHKQRLVLFEKDSCSHFLLQESPIA
jgi:hypothetical protein